MKRFKILAITIIVFCIADKSFAQGTATASSAATIITPITIVKNVNMSFGNVAVSASLPGTVVLDAAGARTTGGGGGVTLPATTGTVAAAKFTVSGQTGYTYAITLPASCTISSGGNTMIVDNFTSNPATGSINPSGSQVLHVGATLNVSAGQAAGTYTNASGVPVTVNYN